MKLRSLFLASLAAMAMVSCSNEDDQIVGNAGEKNALLNFGITVPMATTTRGTTTDASLGEQVGTIPENKINTIMFTVSNGQQTFNSPTYTLDTDFTKNAEGAYVMNDAVNVYPGTSTITVYVNGTETSTVSAYATESLDDLGNIAKVTDENNGNFMMSGFKNGVVITANKVNSVTVEVTRLAAKLVESTPETIFPKTLTNADESQSVEVDITFTDYTFANLNKTSNVIESSNAYFQAGNYFNAYVATNANAEWSNKFKDSKKMTDQITYCLENDNADNATQIHYMAKVTLTGDANDKLMDADGTFYVYNGTMYSWSALRGVKSQGIVMGNLLDANGFTQETDNATLQSKLGIQKFKEGICYYSAPIQTANTAKILRNNWYILKIKSVSGLGLPEIGTPDQDPNTTLLLTTEVKKWTVNTNDFDL